jgi:Tfp pilus assembly protein PilO
MSLWRRVFAERRSWLVPLLALLIIDGVLLGAVVFPLKTTVASAEDEAAAARTTLAQANQRMKMNQNARVSRDRAEKELATFYGSVLPASQAEASRILIVEIARLARENNLRLGARAWEPENVKDSDLQRLTGKVDLIGDYGAILRFIYDVETSEAFLAINNISLSQATRQTGGASGALQLSVEMGTYYRVPK